MTPDLPEMLVGYTRGYRVSGVSYMGGATNSIIDVNPYAWSGDHSMSPDLVPGTLLSSRPIRQQNPNLVDLPVTILDYFGISKPKQMIGKSIFKS